MRSCSGFRDSLALEGAGFHLSPTVMLTELALEGPEHQLVVAEVSPKGFLPAACRHNLV